MLPSPWDKAARKAYGPVGIDVAAPITEIDLSTVGVVGPSICSPPHCWPVVVICCPIPVPKSEASEADHVLHPLVHVLLSNKAPFVGGQTEVHVGSAITIDSCIPSDKAPFVGGRRRYTSEAPLPLIHVYPVTRPPLWGGRRR